MRDGTQCNSCLSCNLCRWGWNSDTWYATWVDEGRTQYNYLLANVICEEVVKPVQMRGGTLSGTCPEKVDLCRWGQHVQMRSHLCRWGLTCVRGVEFSTKFICHVICADEDSMELSTIFILLCKLCRWGVELSAIVFCHATYADEGGTLTCNLGRTQYNYSFANVTCEEVVKSVQMRGGTQCNSCLSCNLCR